MRTGKQVIKRGALGFVRGWKLTKSSPQTLMLVHTDDLDKAILFDSAKDARRFLSCDNAIIIKYQPELKGAFV